MRSVLALLLLSLPAPLLSAEWPRSAPEEQGMFTSVLEGGDQYIRTQCPSRYSFLVVRNGKLVFERYYHGATKDSALHVMSMSKSVLSILIGQALEEKSIDTLDHKMLDYYPEYSTPSMEPRKRDITLRHLLTMTAGFQWDEVATSPQWVASPDWFRFAINLPLAANPGAIFDYDTALSHLLAGILAKSTHTSALDFGVRHLFGPLGITNFRWETDSLGYYIGGFHMYFTPSDFARFGYLYLKKGVWDDQQIVPRDWVETSTRLQMVNTSSIDIGDYGYHWWVKNQWGYPVFMASGYGGQYMFVVPALNLIMVSTTDTANDVRDRHLEAFNLFNLYVVPAIQAARPGAPSVTGIDTVVPGSWVSIYGTKLSATTRAWQPEDFSGINLPTQLDGVSVTINGRPAYIAYVSPGQINVVAPDDDARGTVPVVITNAPNSTSKSTAVLQDANPVLLLWAGKYAVAQHADWSLAAPPELFAGAATSPARPGETIVLWGTGFGATNPITPSGETVAHAALVSLPTVTIGGLIAPVAYAGISAGSAGFYQIQVKIPAEAPDGDLPISLEYAGAASSQTPMIRVQR